MDKWVIYTAGRLNKTINGEIKILEDYMAGYYQGPDIKRAKALIKEMNKDGFNAGIIKSQLIEGEVK
jgi:hypothetical protein